jgi:hypothetical protein
MCEYDSLQGDLSGADFGKKLHWVERLNVRVVVADGEINLTGRYPIKSATVKLHGTFNKPFIGYTGKLAEEPVLTTMLYDQDGILPRDWGSTVVSIASERCSVA